MDIVTLWEYCLDLEYNKAALVDGLEKWLNGQKHDGILDCACGTGFPSIDLITRGFNITCSDSSQEMLERFRINAKKRNVFISPILSRWQELSKHLMGSFDIVMCRGNSLIYADAWDNDQFPSEEAIIEAVRNFRKCLKPGGILYIDTTTNENLTKDEPERNAYNFLNIKNEKVFLEEIVCADKNLNLRHWHSKLTINGIEYIFKRKSYFLRHARLKEILKECGFNNIDQITIEGEQYAVFVAT